MSATRLMQSAAIAAFGLLALLTGTVRAVLPPDAVQTLKAGARAVLEVKVLQVQTAAESTERFDVVYRMEILSVLRASVPVEPGQTIQVRSYGVDQSLLDRGFRPILSDCPTSLRGAVGSGAPG
ncbi:hypothetical protein [Thiocapsa bogorovii]|uniref:hypothetical protein n=1 Tax=Thiocapsa bogorovii TaxID=521689 RepID=UPI001E53A6A7|nr:hypothetical protein [Thiocapsa bogorovii]UHD14316.1 hypothetical protein LT988_13475 [Thiocapsa bogorovii]